MATDTPSIPSICRFCHAFCGIRVTVADGRVTKVIGDVANPLTQGFSCEKGRALPEQHNDPERLLHPWVRDRKGGHHRVTTDELIDDLTRRIETIRDESGPRSIALYTGTFSFHYPAGAEMAKAFMRAIGSEMVFNTGSIDQPGKAIAKSFHGTWSAGPQPFDEADTWMIVGANPTVSMWGGIPQYNPSKRLREARARGMKLIVIDPRRTELARVADIFLQPLPGEDPSLLAGIVRVLFDDDLIDHRFVDAEVEGVDALRRAVEAFTPEFVERRTLVPAADLIAAARLFGRGTRGSVTAGTGPNMAPRGTLTEYLVACIQTLCGRWLRAGEAIPNPYVLRPTRRSRAQADPKVAVDSGTRLRIRGLGANPSGLPASALADEILTPGDGQIRALFSLGGNPLMALPDQLNAAAALRRLDVLVQLDVRWSQTAQLATHVVGCRLGLETEAITLSNERVWGYGAATTGYPIPFAQAAPAVVDAPAGSEVLEEWQLFFRLAQRLGLALQFCGQALDMTIEPSLEQLHDLLCAGSRIPLDEVRRHPNGAVFDDATLVVGPKLDGWTERLDVGHLEMVRQLEEVASESSSGPTTFDRDGEFRYRLISRRLPNVYNSSGITLAKLSRGRAFSPAYMNPSDMRRDGIGDGSRIEIDSGHAAISAIAEAADDVRCGAISMAHGFGSGPELTDHRAEGLATYDASLGAPTSRLVSVRDHYDPIHGLPVMSAIPVNVRLVE